MTRRSLIVMGFGVLGFVGWSMVAGESGNLHRNGLMAANGTPVHVQTPLKSKDYLKVATPGDSDVRLTSRLRPASKKESPQDLELKKLRKAVSPGKLRRPSKKALSDLCHKRSDCRKKLQTINSQKGQRKPRPAAKGETPQDQELKQLPKALKPTHLPRRQPRSELIMPSETPSVLSWLNPLLPPTAYAVPRQLPVSTVLTPGGPRIGKQGKQGLSLYGAQIHPNDQFVLHGNDPGYPNSNAENKAHAYFKFWVPYTGVYLINVRASDGKAKLRHQNGGPIINTWDFLGPGTHNYLTAEYLEHGYHHFYFWPDNSVFNFYSASLESYP